jgi:hypothetical protein
MEILDSYLAGLTPAEAYRRGFRNGLNVTINWGYATGEISGGLMRHLHDLTRPERPPNRRPSEQDPNL